MKTWDLFVDGKRVAGAQTVTVKNPWDQAPVAQVGMADGAQVDAAIAAAERAWKTWKHSSRYQRSEILAAMVTGLKRRRDELVETIVREGGKPRQYAAVEVDRCVTTFTTGAEEARRLHGEEVPVDTEGRTEGYFAVVVRKPLGVIGGISPFNFPLNLVAHKVAPAIATGNTMVLKPASQTPISSHLLAEIAHEAGLPAGVLNVVPCARDVGERLATDPRIRMLTFTGSPQVGWALQGKAVRKKVVLELGGNAAAIVHSDADLEHALARCVAGSFGQAGQTCISVQRILVHDSIFATFMERFVAAAKACRCGDPEQADVVVGPMIDSGNAARVMAWVEEARAEGARMLCGGGRSGNVVEPVVLTDTRPTMKVNAQEVFGPVVTVEPYSTFEDAVAQADDSAFGLQAGIFTHDVRLIHYALDHLEVGGLLVNDVPTQRVDTYPYGGVKDSGLGREGVRYAMEEMTEPRILVMNLRK
ncbi:MAG: aldehyde dehydrogenase family protein [Candidatus Xenobia bacterium]